MESHVLSEARQEALKILLDLAKAIDRRLDVEVREIPGQERLAVTLTHGQKSSHTELAIAAVLDAPGRRRGQARAQAEAQARRRRDALPSDARTTACR
jgi:hypothetical protein